MASFAWIGVIRGTQRRDGRIRLDGGRQCEVDRRRVISANVGPSADIAAIVALELDPDMARGFPVVLAFDRGNFLLPEPTFESEALQRSLAGIYFGSAEEFERELSGVKSVSDSTETGRLTLLHFAAEAGNAAAVRTLVTRGARSDAVGPLKRTALSLAAAHGRLEVVRTILAADAEAGRTVGYDSERKWALFGGHVSVAMEFLENEKNSTRSEAVKELLTMAVYGADQATIESLAARGGENWAERLAPGVLTEGVARRDPVLTRMLLSGGMKAGSIVEGFPLLVTAAKAGDAESVGLLLQNGAKVDRAAGDGTTALMGAVCSGDRATVEIVLGARANLLAQDERRQTAMDRAAAMQRQDLVELLQAHGAPPPTVTAPAKRGKRTDLAGDDCCCQFVGQPIYAATDVDVLPIAKSTPAPELIWSRSRTLERPGVTVTANPITGELSERQPTPRSGGTTSAPRTDHWGVASLVVEPDGTPSSIQIVRASPIAFRNDLEKALQRYEFTPGQRNGQAVRTRLTLVITVPE